MAEGRGGAVWGPEVSCKRFYPQKDDAGRTKKSRPTTVVTGTQAPSQGRSVGGDRGEVSRNKEPDPSPMALGEGQAGGHAGPLATSPRQMGRKLLPSSRAAASVHPVARGSQSRTTPLRLLKPTAWSPEVHTPSIQSSGAQCFTTPLRLLNSSLGLCKYTNFLTFNLSCSPPWDSCVPGPAR